MEVVVFIMIMFFISIILIINYKNRYTNASLVNSIEKMYLNAKRKNWDKIYIAVDIHDTIVYANYDIEEIPTEFIANSKEVLQHLSDRKDIGLILYTCSHPHEIEKYIKYFKENGIEFEYSNKNPEISNTELGCYDHKLYFNLLLDDKACFNAEKDWTVLYETMNNLNFNFKDV